MLNALQYTFQDETLLARVLTRTAAINERLIVLKQPYSFSTLKFLGARVLNLLISDLLFSTRLFKIEGALTHALESVLSRDGQIIEPAQRIGLAEALVLGRGERLSSIHKNEKVLLAHMQALFGAIWVDCNACYEMTLKALRSAFSFTAGTSKNVNSVIEISEGLISPFNFYRLQKKFGYHFKNKNFLINACVRQTALEEMLVVADTDFQIFEFLGDKVFGCIIAEWLITQCGPDYQRSLTLGFNALVSNATVLPAVAVAIDVGAALLVGVGEEEQEGIRTNERRLADHMEALIAALWLDAGKEYNTVKSVVITLFQTEIEALFSKIKARSALRLLERAEFPALLSMKKPLTQCYDDSYKQSMFNKNNKTVKSTGINSFKSIREMVANQIKPDNKLNEQTKFPALVSTKKPLVSSHTNPTKQSMSYAQAALKKPLTQKKLVTQKQRVKLSFFCPANFPALPSTKKSLIQSEFSRNKPPISYAQAALKKPPPRKQSALHRKQVTLPEHSPVIHRHAPDIASEEEFPALGSPSRYHCG